MRELRDGRGRLRVGIEPECKAPAREGTEVRDESGASIGRITSGGFGPSADGPIAMGYVQSAHAKPGSGVALMVRGSARPARIVELPFIQHRYFRKK